MRGEEDNNVPILEEYEVFRKIIKAKKPHSTVQGDIPMKLIKEFGVELSFPLADIINRGFAFGE